MRLTKLKTNEADEAVTRVEAAEADKDQRPRAASCYGARLADVLTRRLRRAP